MTAQPAVSKVLSIALSLGAGAILLLSPATTPAQQQPCNPVIDGTYCATQMRNLPGSSGSSVSIPPIQDMDGAVSLGGGPVGTFVGFSLRGDTACIGLMRRGRCS